MNDDDVAAFIELRHIYDGWSVAKMKDGTYVNRWPEDDRRHKAVQEWLEREEQE